MVRFGGRRGLLSLSLASPLSEANGHTAFAPAATRYHVDFVAKVLQPPESTYLPPLASFLTFKNADSGSTRVQSTYLPRNSHKFGKLHKEELD